MRVKEVSSKGKTKHLYQSELEVMSRARNVSNSAKESFKRKPYSVEGTKTGTKII